jgi:hypothetical protein
MDRRFSRTFSLSGRTPPLLRHQADPLKFEIEAHLGKGQEPVGTLAANRPLDETEKALRKVGAYASKGGRREDRRGRDLFSRDHRSQQAPQHLHVGAGVFGARRSPGAEPLEERLASGIEAHAIRVEIPMDKARLVSRHQGLGQVSANTDHLLQL